MTVRMVELRLDRVLAEAQPLLDLPLVARDSVTQKGVGDSRNALAQAALLDQVGEDREATAPVAGPADLDRRLGQSPRGSAVVRRIDSTRHP